MPKLQTICKSKMRLIIFTLAPLPKKEVELSFQSSKERRSSSNFMKQMSNEHPEYNVLYANESTDQIDGPSL